MKPIKYKQVDWLITPPPIRINSLAKTKIRTGPNFAQLSRFIDGHRKTIFALEIIYIKAHY